MLSLDGSLRTSLTVSMFRCDRLFQVKMEREKYQSEIRDLQDQLSEMHDELDSAKKSAAADEEKDALMAVHQHRMIQDCTHEHLKPSQEH